MTKNENFKNDVTLLLTIFERKKYTLRWLNYANQLKIPLNIFISDGSKQKQLTNLELKQYKNLKIHYKKFKYYKNFKKYSEKFFLSLKFLKTKYVFLCEDDDFIILKNIYKSYLFLENNKNFIASGGVNLYCDLKVKINNTFNYLYFFQYDNQYLPDTRIINNRNCVKRIIKNTKNPYACWNILFRTKVLKKIFYHLNYLNIKNYYNVELIHGFLTALYGQVNRFNHLEYIKTADTEYSSSRMFMESKLFGNYLLNGKKEAYKILLYFFTKYKNKIGTKNFKRIKNVFIKKITDDYNKKKLDENNNRVFKTKFIQTNFFFLKKIKYFKLLFKKNYHKKIFFASYKEKKTLKNSLNEIIDLMNFLKRNNSFLSKF